MLFILFICAIFHIVEIFLLAHIQHTNIYVILQNQNARDNTTFSFINQVEIEKPENYWSINRCKEMNVIICIISYIMLHHQCHIQLRKRQNKKNDEHIILIMLISSQSNCFSHLFYVRMIASIRDEHMLKSKSNNQILLEKQMKISCIVLLSSWMNVTWY